MNKSKPVFLRCIQTGISALALTFAFCGYNQGYAQTQTFKALITEADVILAAPYNTPDRARDVQKRVSDILEKIRKSEKSLVSAEERSLQRIYVTLLEKRNNACQLAIDGNPLPSKDATQKQELQDCIGLLEAYVADTTRSVFVDTTRIADIEIQKAFLRQLISCLNSFTDNANSLREASSLLTKLFIYKRPGLGPFIQILSSDPIAAQKISRLLVQSGNVEAAARLLAEMIKAGYDTERLGSLIHSMFSAADTPTLVKLFETILSEFAGDPERMAWLQLQVSQAATFQPQQRILKPLLDLMERFRNAKLLSNIFQLLLETLPPDTSSKQWQMATAIRRIQNGLLQHVEDQFSSAGRLSKLANQAKLLLQQQNDRKLRLRFIELWRSGDFQKVMPASHYQAINRQLTRAFGANYSVEATALDLPDSVKFIDETSTGRQVQKPNLDELTKSKRKTRQQPDIVVAGSYNYTGINAALVVQLRMIDAASGIILGAYSEEIAFEEDAGDFAVHAQAAARRLAEAFKTDLEAYLEFEIFSGTFTADASDLQKFRSYLFYNSIFEVEQGEAYDTQRGMVADRIYIEEDFFTKHNAGKRFSPVLAALKKNITDVYPELLPMITGKAAIEQTQGNYLYIRGDPGQPGNEWTMHVQVRRGYTNVLKLHVKFKPNPNADIITQIQAEYAAGFITESLRSFLGFNQKYFKDAVRKKAEEVATSQNLKHISQWNAFPSLLLPGSSQLIIADRLDAASISQNKKRGRGLLIASSVLFGLAIYFDQTAIDRADNGRLRARNYLLGGAGAMGLVSAYFAHKAIGRHNQNLDQSSDNTKQQERPITQKK